MDQFAGKTVFIAGAAQGIGLGMARAFAREGAELALVDLDGALLERVREELADTTTVATFVLDVRDRSGFERVADEVETELGPVSVLCNNAGVGSGLGLAEMTYAHWDLVIGVNLGGVVNGIQTFLPRMVERGGGRHVRSAAHSARTTRNRAHGVVSRHGGHQYHGDQPGSDPTASHERSAEEQAAVDEAWAARETLLGTMELDPGVVGDKVLAAIGTTSSTCTPTGSWSTRSPLEPPRFSTRCPRRPNTTEPSPPCYARD